MVNVKLILLHALVWIIPLFAHGQQQLSGRILNNANEPIVGANVFIKGTSQGTTTDASGNFKLAVQGDSLSVSFIGYKPQTVAIAGQTNLTIYLASDDHALDDVIVVGYGTQSRRNVTGAVSDIKSEDILRSSSTTTAGALAGKVQGISVRAKDARPGKGASL